MSSRHLRFVLPIRTSKRKKEAKSPQQQRDLASSWALAHSHDIVKVLDSGRDESGKTMDRATIHEAMRMVRAGDADGIVFALTDRLGRAPIEESMAWIRQLNLVGHLALADAGGGPVDLSDPNAETALVMQLQFARQYWLAAARRFRQSQRDAVKAGKWIGAAPLGYRRELGRLHEHDVHGPFIREAYRHAAQDGIHAAVSYLQTVVPERVWNTDHVRRLLASRCYLGENQYVLHADPGNFDAELLVSPKRHDALTDAVTWQAAQTEPHMRRSNGEYPLSHAVHCGRCDAGLVGALQSVNGKRYRRMRCSVPCVGGVSISADQLERHVRAELEEALADATFRLRFTGGDVAGALAALELVEAERRALTKKVKPSHPDFEAWLADADAAVERAQRDYRREAAANLRTEQLPDGKLTDTAKLLRAIRVSGVHIRVVPGRGTIGERVKIDVPDDVDDSTGMLAA